MELLDIYDYNNKLVDKGIDRKKVHEKGMWHRESVVIVMNEKKQILLQKRSYQRHNYPGKWGLIAGHVFSGDNPKKTAVRELKEEIGLKILPTDLKFLKIYIKNTKSNKAFIYIYLLITNIKENEFNIQKEELTEVKYYNIDTLIKRIKENDKSLVFGGDNSHIELFTQIKDFTI